MKTVDAQNWVLDFTVTQKMVDHFVQLTGDSSSLHTKPMFARRSVYRSTVVHGMLPVMFIAGLDFLKEESENSHLSQIVGKFLKPVFAGDQLHLRVREKKSPEPTDKAHYDFEIINQASGIVVTNGYFIVRSGSGTSLGKSKLNTMPAGMIYDELKEEDFLLENISKGEQRQFRFALTKMSLSILADILKCGQVTVDANLTIRSAVSLLPTALLSTMAGLCLPGKYATFIDFNLQFAEPFVLDTVYCFKGEVGFKSDKLRVIVNDVQIRAEDHPEKNIASGKMTVKVNAPPVDSAMISSLKVNIKESSLNGKVVLITGASRGIGATTAKLFAVHGAKVAVNFFMGEEDAKAVVKDIESIGGQAIEVQANVSDLGQVKKMISFISAKYGTIDILVNNAIRDARPIPFAELSWDEIQKEMDVTVKGSVNCCREVLPLMVKQGQGKIINMGTIFTDQPVANQAKYILTKSALLGLTKSLAVEYAPFNIQVNMVSPNVVETDLSQGAGDLFSKVKDKMQPVDVATTIVALAAGQLPFATGQKIMVNAGQAPSL